jgi:hypothetical protein
MSHIPRGVERDTVFPHVVGQRGQNKPELVHADLKGFRILRFGGNEVLSPVGQQ